MNYRLRPFAAEHFAEITHRKLREHAGEERLVEMFLGVDGQAPPGVFIEVGANDPVQYSQSYHLEQHGWRGLLVEPIPELCERLRAQRPNSTVIQAACGSPQQVGMAQFHVAKAHGQSTLAPGEANVGVAFDRVMDVQVRTLDQIIDEAQLGRLDFISIDVEGVQMDVLQGFDLQRHRPRLLLMEDHLHDLKTHRYITSTGYRLVKRTGLNNWYIPAEDRCELTTFGERLALRMKLLRTPLRSLQYAIKRALTK